MRRSILLFKKASLNALGMSFQMSSQKSGGKGSALGTECISCIAPGLGWLLVDDDVSGFAEKPGGLKKRSSDGAG